MLSRIVLALILVALVTPAVAQEAAPTVDDILAKHYAARGGLEKLKALSSLKLTGTISAQGFMLPVTMLRQRPNYFRLDADLQGMAILQAFDGKQAWGTNPMAGVVEPEPFSGGEAEQIKEQADFDGLLIEPRKRGSRVELIGKEAFGEGEAYRLKVTLKGGAEREVLLDAISFLERKQFTDVEVQGMAMTAEVTFDDYREVAGVVMPHRQLTVMPMGEFELVLSSIEAGVDIDAEVFLMPGQEANPELSLEQILEQHRRARLKAGNDQITTVKATGKVLFQGFQLPMTMFFKRPRSFRVNVDLQGLEMIQAYDGEVAWSVSPMQGITEPEAMPDEAKDAVAIFSDFIWGLLTSFEQSKAKLELAGIAKVERDETYHLKVSFDGEAERQVFLGGKDFLERQLSFSTVFMGTAGTMDALLSDYKTVDGLVLPHLIQLRVGGVSQGEMRIETVEVNAEVDASIFSMPPLPTTEPAAEAPPQEGR